MHKNLVRLQLVLVVTCGVLMLGGCEDDDRRAALHANPEITDIGEFDGCAVRYVNRGTHDRSFYLAKCDTPSATVTNNYETPTGKSRYPDQNVTIQKNPGAQAVSNVLESQKEKLRQQEVFLDQQYKKLQEAKKLLESVEASQVGR